MTERTDILVIGAGVIGLTTAVCLAEAGVPVRVRASEPPRASTSAVAGAIVTGPPPADPMEAKWTLATHDAFAALVGVAGSGVHSARGRTVSRDGEGTPDWATSMPGFEECSAEEHTGFPVAFWMTGLLVDMPRFLEYLTARLTSAGGDIDYKTVDSLADLAGAASIVVNCTGMGAEKLAADDLMRPVRGQHVVVENPGIEDYFYERSQAATLTSYIPHGQRLVLGGTIERGVRSLDPDPAQTEAILSRCAAIDPRIAGARILSVDVGLRPARPQVRLEEENASGTRLIHNYGHGGAGVTMSWGCAQEVTGLVLGS